ncbi:hypothetical protein FOZ63_028804, partial [Perkinsus olseni]
STIRVVRGEESMSSEFGGGGGMPPQHPIRVNHSYPNVPRETSGEGSSVGDSVGHEKPDIEEACAGPIFGRAALLRRHAEMMQKGFDAVENGSKKESKKEQFSAILGTDCLLGSTWRSVVCDGQVSVDGLTVSEQKRRTGHGVFALADGTLFLLGGRQLCGEMFDGVGT